MWDKTKAKERIAIRRLRDEACTRVRLGVEELDNYHISALRSGKIGVPIQRLMREELKNTEEEHKARLKTYHATA